MLIHPSLAANRIEVNLARIFPEAQADESWMRTQWEAETGVKDVFRTRLWSGNTIQKSLLMAVHTARNHLDDADIFCWLELDSAFIAENLRAFARVQNLRAEEPYFVAALHLGMKLQVGIFPHTAGGICVTKAGLARLARHLERLEMDAVKYPFPKRALASVCRGLAQAARWDRPSPAKDAAAAALSGILPELEPRSRLLLWASKADREIQDAEDLRVLGEEIEVKVLKVFDHDFPGRKLDVDCTICPHCRMCTWSSRGSKPCVFDTDEGRAGGLCGCGLGPGACVICGVCYKCRSQPCLRERPPDLPPSESAREQPEALDLPLQEHPTPQA
ncbi:unnamed protein product [Effrenium voratum]|nr:unnamed protein product [Effrenium voratum]